MGQDITVEALPSTGESTYVYSLNRSLTGMDIFGYENVDDVPEDNDPANILSRKLLELGANSVSIYSNVVTIKCDQAKFSSIKNDVEETMQSLFRFY